MVKVENGEVIQKLQDVARPQFPFQIPTELNKDIVPTIEINPALQRIANIIRAGAANNATSATIYTTPSDRDFYIVAAHLSVSKDATNTSTSSALDVQAAEDNSGRTILQLATTTLTVQQASLSISFPTPLKVARGTPIRVLNDTGVANITTQGGIVGYIDETRK